MSDLVQIPKKKMLSHIKDIADMSKKDLISFCQKVQLSNADDKSKKILNMACDIRMIELREEITLSPLAVASELDENWSD